MKKYLLCLSLLACGSPAAMQPEQPVMPKVQISANTVKAQDWTIKLPQGWNIERVSDNDMLATIPEQQVVFTFHQNGFTGQLFSLSTATKFLLEKKNFEVSEWETFNLNGTNTMKTFVDDQTSQAKGMLLITATGLHGYAIGCGGLRENNETNMTLCNEAVSGVVIRQ